MDIKPHLRYTATLTDPADKRDRKNSDRKHNLQRPFINTGKLLKWAFTGERTKFTKTAHEERKAGRAAIGLPKHYGDWHAATANPQADPSSKDSGTTSSSSDPGLKLGNPHAHSTFATPSTGIAHDSSESSDHYAKGKGNGKGKGKETSSSAAPGQLKSVDHAQAATAPVAISPSQAKVIADVANTLREALGRFHNRERVAVDAVRFSWGHGNDVPHTISDEFKKARKAAIELAAAPGQEETVGNHFDAAIRQQIGFLLPGKLATDYQALLAKHKGEPDLSVGNRVAAWLSGDSPKTSPAKAIAASLSEPQKAASAVPHGAIPKTQGNDAQTLANLKTDAKKVALAARAAIRTQCEVDDAALEGAEPEAYDPNKPLESLEELTKRQDTFMAPYRTVMQAASHELVKTLSQLPNPAAAIRDQLKVVWGGQATNHEIAQAYWMVRDGLQEGASSGILGDRLDKEFKATVEQALIDSLRAGPTGGGHELKNVGNGSSSLEKWNDPKVAAATSHFKKNEPVLHSFLESALHAADVLSYLHGGTPTNSRMGKIIDTLIDVACRNLPHDLKEEGQNQVKSQILMSTLRQFPSLVAPKEMMVNSTWYKTREKAIEKEHAEGKDLGKHEDIQGLIASAGSKPSDALQALGWAWQGPFATRANFPETFAVAKIKVGKGGVYDPDQRRNDFNNAVRSGLVAKLSEEDQGTYEKMTRELTKENYAEVQQKVIAWVGSKVPKLPTVSALN